MLRRVRAYRVRMPCLQVGIVFDRVSIGQNKTVRPIRRKSDIRTVSSRQSPQLATNRIVIIPNNFRLVTPRTYIIFIAAVVHLFQL